MTIKFQYQRGTPLGRVQIINNKEFVDTGKFGKGKILFLENKVANTLIEEKLAELRQNLIAEKTNECDKQIMAEIEIQADSILIYMSKRIKYDSLTIPFDSIRPIKPEMEFPKYKKPEKPKEQ